MWGLSTGVLNFTGRFCNTKIHIINFEIVGHVFMHNLSRSATLFTWPAIGSNATTGIYSVVFAARGLGAAVVSVVVAAFVSVLVSALLAGAFSVGVVDWF